jgi:hypothetical protein
MNEAVSKVYLSQRSQSPVKIIGSAKIAKLYMAE